MNFRPKRLQNCDSDEADGRISVSDHVGRYLPTGLCQKQRNTQIQLTRDHSFRVHVMHVGKCPYAACSWSVFVIIPKNEKAPREKLK
jgi:hypothetical protein